MISRANYRTPKELGKLIQEKGYTKRKFGVEELNDCLEKKIKGVKKIKKNLGVPDSRDSQYEDVQDKIKEIEG